MQDAGQIQRNFAAQRVRQLTGSATLAASQRVREMRDRGITVIDFGVGEPDFPTPAHVVAAAKDALDRGFTHYSPASGHPPLLRAISHTAQRDYGISYDPKSEIVVTPGAKQALFEIFLALVETGDEILLPEPAWVSYSAGIHLAGGTARPIPLSPQNGYRLTDEILSAAVTARTKGLVLCSPSNPTGHVLTEEELAAAAAVARRHDLFVISDQIYEKIRYDGRVLRTIAALAGMRERTLIVGGFSKAYAMTGWRLGYLMGPEILVREVKKVHEHSATVAATFSMVAATAALEGPQEPLERMVQVYQHRRDIVAGHLSTLSGVLLPHMEGAFYAFPDVGALGIDSTTLASRLLDEAHVSVTPGVAFGASADRHIRISYAVDETSLDEGLARIRRFCEGSLA